MLTPASGFAADTPQFKPVVMISEKNDRSPALRTVKPLPVRRYRRVREMPLGRAPIQRAYQKQTDPVIQTWHGYATFDSISAKLASAPLMPSTARNFEGIDNTYNVLPPDTNGAVGPNNYVQVVNLGFQIWDKSGNSLYGPADINTIWSGFGGECQSENDGDPVVLYDQLADRWIISQFALGPSYTGPYYQCVAVSQTGDPTGAWYRYAFPYSNTIMNDYPKLAVWPDGYYMSANQFDSKGLSAGVGVAAFERDKMLSGQPAQMVYFDLDGVYNYYFGLLPADLDGPPPAPGTPDYFAAFFTPSSFVIGGDQLDIWDFHVDWANPANSTFGQYGHYSNYVLYTAAFNLMPCTVSGSANCISQPGVSSSSYLDAIGDRLMYRLQYRNFGSYSSMVVNHTVEAGGGIAGIRWYEVHNSGTGWSLYQQGTYAPADGINRWMGSIAADSQDNLALGYSISNSTVYPSIDYAGRLAGDPLGTLPQAETSIINGTGSQTSSSGRWGDYSSIAVDPADGCTFWYTTEYIQTTGTAPWKTRIASFKYPGCSTPLSIITQSLPDGTIGQSYYQTVTATGGTSPYTWSITTGSLPTGLAFNGSTGVISGTPTVLGTFSFTIQAQDANANTASQAFSIYVNPMTITTTSLPYGITGTAYSQTLGISGGFTPLNWTITSGSLPAGLALNNSTGVISGTPSATGTFSFTVQAQDAKSSTATQALSIAVFDPLAISTASLANGTVGSSYSQTLAATGGLTPYTWMITYGSLPGGLSMNSLGTFSGTPTDTGTFSFNIQVQDANSNTATKALSISTYYSVTPSAGVGGSISPGTSQPVLYNGTTSFTITPAGGYSIYSVTGCGGTLSGNTYTTGQITGNCTFQVTFAANGAGVAMIAGGSQTYSTVGAAYNAAASGNTIEVQAVETAESPVFNLPISVTIQGGYDGGFTSAGGNTGVGGQMTFRNGTVIIKNVVVN